MVISNYQINNVLRVYGEQLRQTKISSKVKNLGAGSPDRINISAEAKRKAVIEKITADIVEKITQFGPNNNMEREVFKKLEAEYGASLAITKKDSNELIFKVIDEDGETINSLSIEDSKFLRHKLEEITKNTVKQNMM